MTITNELQELQQHLEKFGQQHLLTFWDELNESERELLKKDIEEIDFLRYFNDLTKAEEKSVMTRKKMVDNELEPPSPEQCGSWTDCSREQLDKYNDIGLEYVSNGQYCTILMSGGAGTRLGFKYPKGMYKVGLPSDKSLFQLQAERLLRLQYLALRRFGKTAPIMWYVMTSDCTRDDTMDFFRKNDYFGLKHDQIIFFEQCTLPVVGFDGKILLESKFRVSKSPDGNGGLYRALHNYKLIDDMKARNIKYAMVYGVDNILVKVADPVFLGFAVEQGAECAAKVVEKIQPKEAVGIVGKVNGHFQVVEYSEISTETATMLDENDENKLKYRCGNICMHLFSTEFLERICQIDITDLIVQHIAIKKVPFINLKTGLFEKPEKENGIKMERFVFDVFPLANTFAIWEVERNREFSPIKNSPGSRSDCPETARDDIFQYHNQLVLEHVHDSNLRDKVKGMVFEISPLVSYSGEDLENVSHLVTKSAERSILHLESKIDDE